MSIYTLIDGTSIVYRELIRSDFATTSTDWTG